MNVTVQCFHLRNHNFQPSDAGPVSSATHKPAFFRSTTTRWRTPSARSQSVKRIGYSPDRNVPVNAPLPFKPCSVPRNSTNSIPPHSLQTPSPNYPPGPITASMNCCRLHQHSFNHLNSRKDRWERWTVTILPTIACDQRCPQPY